MLVIAAASILPFFDRPSASAARGQRVEVPAEPTTEAVMRTTQHLDFQRIGALLLAVLVTRLAVNGIKS
jgi:hypothetical protein